MKMKYFRMFLVAAFFMSLFGAPAGATTITFDNLVVPDEPEGTFYGSVPDGYEGLSWDNFYFINGANHPVTPNGFMAGTVSPSNVAFKGSSDAIISASVPFTFTSGYFTGAWNDRLEVTFTGYLEGVMVRSPVTYFVDSTEPEFISLNWANIDELVISSAGGIVHGYPYGAQGTQVVMDNLIVSGVPLPAALPLFGAALAGLVGFGVRRRKACL
jgi:hypothetical protein